jgi:hypothetical protein
LATLSIGVKDHKQGQCTLSVLVWRTRPEKLH